MFERHECLADGEQGAFRGVGVLFEQKCVKT
jgi:hypothetical protein